MNSDNEWLNEMMDAALTDSPDSVTEPDFQAIRQASRGAARFRHHPGRRTFIAAAAAVLAVSLVVPTGIIVNRRLTTRRLINEQNIFFVEELIGGNLFDEGLVSDETWLLDTIVDENFFDI